MAEPGVRFLYVPAIDLDAMRDFYSDVLGLNEIWFKPGQGVAYDCDGFQFAIFFDPGDNTVLGEWATQPGWKGDTVGSISWSVVLSESGYRTAVDRLTASPDVPTMLREPQWVGYWSFPVRDPMGNTVELSWPDTAPSSPRWSDR